MSDIRNQLKSQDLDTVLPSAFKQVGGVVFPDNNAVVNLNDLQQIVKSYQAVHAPTFGSTIPNSGVQIDNIEDLGTIAPSDNEVYEILAVNLTNQGATDPITVTVAIGDVVLVSQPVDPSTAVSSSELGALFPLRIPKPLKLIFNVIEGTASDFVGAVVYSKIVQ